MRVTIMKLYTLHDAAIALGTDTAMLHDWLARNRRDVLTNLHDEDQPLLSREQIEDIARTQRVPLLPQQLSEGETTRNSTAQRNTIQLGAPVIDFGRNEQNTVSLNHPQVSGNHARLEQVNNSNDSGSYRIQALDSSNPVYVNSQRIRKELLKQGDEIRIGPFKFTYRDKQLIPNEESSIRVDAFHLQAVGNRRTPLLSDISLSIPQNAFVVLLGSSGAGKSMLLEALNGLRRAHKGVVLYNGQDYYSHIDDYSTQLGYVPQDDIIHRNLTVGRALYYAARLRLPNDFSHAQIKRRINEVLDDVGMQHRRRFLVRKLSGGERKRVSIALELLANPSIFFLDEPTSGLDPGLDRKMMLLLRELADKGHTVVLVTHTITNVDLCDLVCFLTRGGRLAYYGPPQEAKAYFGTDNFAQIYNALEPTDEHKKIPEEAEERFKQSPYYQWYVVEPLEQERAWTAQAEAIAPIKTNTVKRHTHAWKQFFLLCRRYVELLKNDVGNLLILLLQAPIIGLILFFLAGHGTFSTTSITACPTRANILATSGPIVSINCQRVVNFLNSPAGQNAAAQQGKTRTQLLQNAIQPDSGANAQVVLFIMAFAAVLFGCINGSREIVKEAPIYRRERAVNLGIAPYMFSKIVILGILCLFQSIILVLMVNQKAPFQRGIFLPILVEIYITMALTSLAGLMLGLTISALAPNTDRAMSFVPLVLVPQVIFAGILFKLNTPFLQVLGALFPARWAMAGMGSSIGLHGNKLGVDNFAYQGTLFVSMHPNSALPAAIAHLILVWIALTLIILILGGTIAYFLKRR